MPPHVISASRRTDIPAFFTPWWMHRLREGHVMVRNPRNSAQVVRVSLHPDDVVAVVFWSRDYGRLIPHLDEIDDRGLRPLFHLTLTGYGPPFELRGPSSDAVISQFETLSRRYGRNRVVWRYDPILLGTRHDAAHHLLRFEHLAGLLSPFTSRCVVSFLDRYPSTLRELALVQDATGERFDAPSLAERLALASSLLDIARARNMELSACSEPDLMPIIPRARCIDPDLLRAFAIEPPGGFRDAPTRKGCGCVLARDVGSYHTCAHGCVYCYACESPDRASSNAKAVSMTANTLGPQDILEAAPVRRSRQLSLLDSPASQGGGRPPSRR